MRYYLIGLKIDEETHFLIGIMHGSTTWEGKSVEGKAYWTTDSSQEISVIEESNAEKALKLIHKNFPDAFLVEYPLTQMTLELMQGKII